jgi:hypothetical protein
MHTDANRLSRRDVLRFFSTATALFAVVPVGAAEAGQGAPAAAPAATPVGYGTDPSLLKTWAPGDAWPLTLTADQRRTVTVLADTILPADALGPAASALRVPDYIDEWISAPYAPQVESRPRILAGLAWIEGEAQARFGHSLSDCSAAERGAILDDIADSRKAAPQRRAAASFFTTFRALASGAYYATPEGWRAIGYVGNVPTASFDGPPPEVLARLGLEQTVK